MNTHEEIVLTVISGKIPKNLYDYTVEECTLLLQIGSDMIESFKENKIKIDNSEKEKQWEEQYKEQEQRIETQKNAYQFMMEEYKRILYGQFLEQYQERLSNKDLYIEELKERLIEQKTKTEFLDQTIQVESKKMYEMESGSKIERLNLALDKLDTQVHKVQEIYSSQTKQESMKYIGDVGEIKFQALAQESFKFFEKFELIHTATEANKGDFHMQFKDFNVLVDVKNWDNMVTNGEREKLHRDLLGTDMMFGWMVSLKTDIRKFDNFPISVEWLRPDKCIIYVNSLMKHHNPVEFLRLVWNFCNMMKQLSKNEDKPEDKPTDLQEIYENVKKLEVILKDETTIINDLSKNIDRLKETNKSIKDLIKDHLNDKSNELLNNMSCKKLSRKPRTKKPVVDEPIIPV
jgi:predicted RNase H-like nuclease (RuvC/YqgF family)